MPDDWIDQEVANDAQSIGLRFRVYAETSDGRRFESNGDSAGVGLSGIAGQGLERDREERTRHYEAAALEATREMAEDQEWLYSELIGALRGADPEFDAARLNELPRAVEIDRAAIPAAIGRLLDAPE
jgi:hypothetical protein